MARSLAQDAPSKAKRQLPTNIKLTGATPSSYIPLYPATGPAYMDQQICTCALRSLDGGDVAAWRCLGNASTNAYTGQSGKWFWPRQNTSGIDPVGLSINDAQYAPDLSAPFAAPAGSNPADNPSFLVPLTGQHMALSIFDQACNGTNKTDTTGVYYQAQAELRAGQEPISAAPCINPYAVQNPVPIQNASSWQETGCQPGFFCPNNSVNALPYYCTPVEQCLAARLAGFDCGVPMGPFEPTVCQQGFFCPPGGREQTKCPSGHFCPPGTVDPIKCSVGASCPPGSIKNMGFLPLGFLAVLDIILIITSFVLWIKKRREERRRGRNDREAIPKARKNLFTSSIGLKDLKSRGSGYKSLDDEEDGEVLLEPRITSLKRSNTTFIGAALDPQFVYSRLMATEGAPNDESNELRAFVQSMSRAIQGSQFGLSFEFHDLMFKPKGAQKPVLSQVSGRIQRAKHTGVMGGSGAGKSTFLNVLMGKQKSTSGQVKVNGLPDRISRYKKIIGYVPQDDSSVLAELTVRENILHSARIRLPKSWNKKDIESHVDTLLECLQLSHVANSLVGSAIKPVISGGQKKRVSIGMELAAAPMALFLDEPTSGLDATSAGDVMKTLTALSKLGITVVSIIHQPREDIFEQLDDVILLGDGRLIFQGKQAQVQHHFEVIGFHFPDSNPADTLMDIITGQGRPYKTSGEVSKQVLIEHWANVSKSQNFTNTDVASNVESSALRTTVKMRGASFPLQFWYCLMRSFLQQYRMLSSFWFEMGLAALGGFLIGLAENSADGILFSGFYVDNYVMLSSAINYMNAPIMALLVAIAIGLVASAPAVKVFGEEKLTYWREAASGHNRLAYYLGKVISTLPRIFLTCLHFTTLFDLLATPRISWLTSFYANLLYFFDIYGLAACVSMVTRREDGPLLATMAALIVGVLSGFAPQLSQVKEWGVIWLWDMSPGVWIAQIYFSETIFPTNYLYDVQNAADTTGFVLNQVALDSLILFGIGMVYRFLAFFELILVNRAKQR